MLDGLIFERSGLPSVAKKVSRVYIYRVSGYNFVRNYLLFLVVHSQNLL